MIHRIQSARREFPRQFWLMFWGMLISTTGSSMIWPFLMIYISEKLGRPLSEIAILMTINSIMGLIFSFFAGQFADRIGRKGVMVFSLLINGLVYLFMPGANTMLAVGIIMAITGSVQPLYRVGADAMLADLIPPEKRADAYSLTRMSNNVGVALGPALGGFIAYISYSYAFLIAAVGMVTYCLLLFFFAKETLPQHAAAAARQKEAFGGYGQVLSDGKFMPFIAAITLTTITASMMWVMLSVYAKQNFGITENQYGWIPTTNAVMVVFLQLTVTTVSKRYPTLLVLAAGAFFYAIGVGSVALGGGFWAFWISMVVMTIGELILVPTATTYAANLAPADKRGRYMSIYNFTWGAAYGIGPILAGNLNDRIAPVAIWYGALVIGLASASLLLVLYRQVKPVMSTER